MRRLIEVVVAGIGLLLLLPFPAYANPADYVIVAPEATLSKGDDGTTASYTLINLTDRPSGTVSLKTTEAGAHCDPSSDTAALPARQEKVVTFTLKGCDAPENKTINLSLNVGSTIFTVTAEAEVKPDPDWRILWVFAVALVGGLVLVIAGWVWFEQRRPQTLAKNPPVPKENVPSVWPNTPLPYLGASWSFKDSWASNVTLVSAAFTGLFGTSDLLKSATGAAAPSALAVITIASAIAAAIVGVAPLLLQTFRNGNDEVYAGALFGSAALVIAAAGGLVLAIALSVSPLVTGLSDNLLWVGVVIGLVILASYAVASIRQNLTKGLTKPPTKKSRPSEGKPAVVGALRGAVGDNLDDQQFQDTVAQPLDDAYAELDQTYALLNQAAALHGISQPSALI
jgi:hypothetical protein